MRVFIMKCEDCGKSDETVERLNCPYDEEIHSMITVITVCSDCYDERLNDI